MSNGIWNPLKMGLENWKQLGGFEFVEITVGILYKGQ